MPDIRNNIAHYDINKPEDLAVLISSGLIWKGGPKAVSKALNALRSGAVPRPANLPADIVAWLDRTVPASVTPEEAAAGVTEDELEEAPPAVVEEEDDLGSPPA